MLYLFNPASAPQNSPNTNPMLLPQLTELEQDTAWLTSLILRMAEATHNVACVSTSVNYEFWNTLSDERLLALLNADVSRSLAILAGNTTLGGPVNASLESIGLARFSHRAPTEPGRTDISFDGKQFFLIPPVEVPEEPAPTEEPQ